MNTNQLLTISFPKGTLDIFHKTQMGNLNQLLQMANVHRFEEGKNAIRLDTFLNRKNTKDFIKSVMRVEDLSLEEVIKVKGRGKGAKTYANLFLLIYCSEQLSTDFHVHVIKIFINNQILKSRDDGGNDFKELNHYLNKMGDRKDCKDNRSLFIQVALKLRFKIFGSEIMEKFNKDKECGILHTNFNIWNSKYANSVHQDKRVKYENLLINYIQMDFVNSKDEIYKAIEKLI